MLLLSNVRALSLAAASLALRALPGATPRSASASPGATPSLTHSSEPGAAAFLPYNTFGAANRRTGVLFCVNTCGGGGSAAQSSISLFPPAANTFELREDFGAGFAALSADSTSWPLGIGSAPVAVNELYRARFLLLLDVSASALALYSSSGALDALSTGISSVLSSGFNTLYAASRTQPVEFAIYAFAGDTTPLVPLTQWSAFDQGADSVLFQGGGSINPAYLLSRAYPFVSDSTALYWAVPAALTELQARSAAGTAADLYPATMDTLVVVSDFLDTAGQRPAGAQTGQGARQAFQAATAAAAAQGVAFIAVPLSASPDSDVQSAEDARAYLAQLPGSAGAALSTWGTAVNTRFARGVGAYVPPPGTAWDANTLSMLTFCPADTAGEPDARGMEVRAGALARALPPAPTPTGLATALRYPSPPPGRCNPTQLAQATPAPSADPCAPPPPPPPAPPVVSACTFFAGGGSGVGRTTGRTARGLRLECPSAYPAVPTRLPTPTPSFCAGGGGGGAAAAPVAVEVTSSVTPPGTSAGFALLILAVLALVGVVGVAARNVGALAMGGGGGAAAPPRQQHLPSSFSSAEGAGKGPASSGGVAGNPLNLPGAAVGVQNW